MKGKVSGGLATRLGWAWLLYSDSCSRAGSNLTAIDLLSLYERPHPAGSQGAVRGGDPHTTGRHVRKLCQQYSISDRMPRPIIPGDERALSKRGVEAWA